jgi:sugar O-acyltransferase (sialic acid O-acetyltransferase NeuD family)
MEKIFLFGGGANAHCCIDIVHKTNGYTIAGILDSLHPIGSEIYGYPVLGRQEDLRELSKRHAVNSGFITFGYNWSRQALAEIVQANFPDFKFVNLIHPSASIGMDAELGSGILMLAHSSVNPGCKIADFVHIGVGSSLEHDGEMASFSSMFGGVATGGRVFFGKGSAAMLGSVIADGVRIGAQTVVGAGSVVLKDIPAKVLAYGSPAKVIRARKHDEPYFQNS